MKKLIVILALSLVACLPSSRDARSALDVVQTACIIANAALPESKVAEVCGIAGPFMDPLRSLLASSRAAGSTRWSTAGAPYRGQQISPVVCASTNNGVECWEAPAR